MIRPSGWWAGSARSPMSASEASLRSVIRKIIRWPKTVPVCPISAVRSVLNTARSPTALPSRRICSSVSISRP